MCWWGGHGCQQIFELSETVSKTVDPETTISTEKSKQVDLSLSPIKIIITSVFPTQFGYVMILLLFQMLSCTRDTYVVNNIWLYMCTNFRLFFGEIIYFCFVNITATGEPTENIKRRCTTSWWRYQQNL